MSNWDSEMNMNISMRVEFNLIKKLIKQWKIRNIQIYESGGY